MTTRSTDHLSGLSPDQRAVVEERIKAFEQAWQRGERPAIAEHLPADPVVRLAVLVELVHIDLERRIEAGETRHAESYLKEFPELAEDSRRVADLVAAEQDQRTGLAATATILAPDFPQAGPPLGERIRYFGDYELLEEIARGGMGVVYKARQVSLNRIVALKMILSGQFASEADVERFYTEAKAAANLQHPNIVAIHEVGQHEGQHYFSMDYIEGKSLAQVVRENPLPAIKAAGYVKTIAETIEFAHQRGILHRDLKPANVLIDSFDQPRVTDFGLAKRIDGTAQLTATGLVVGTPSYMPPEQAGANYGKVGPVSDVYSLGAVLYQLVTGRPPFLGESLAVTLNQVLNTEPVPPRLLNPEVPRDLETICLTCLEKEPSKRYGTAAAFADDLGRFLRNEPIMARPVGTPERTWRWCRRNPMVASLVAAVAVLLLVSGIGGTTLGVVANQNARRADANAALASDETKNARNAQFIAEEEKRRAEAALNQSEWRLYASQIVAAQRDWETNHARVAWDDLYFCRDDFRGWEHDYLQTHFSQSQQTLRGHTGFVSSVAFSPNGKRIASGSRDGTIKVWDAISGREILTLKGHPGMVNSVAFSPDGKRIVGGGTDAQGGVPGNGNNAIKLWDAISGREIFTLKGHSSGVVSVTFSPDGKRIASSGGSEIKIWDATSGEEILTLKGHRNGVLSVAFCPDGKRIASGSGDMTMKVWDAINGQEILTLKGHSSGVKSVAFSPDGKRIASSGGSEIKIWDATSGEEILTLKGHRNGVLSVAFCPDGKRIASGSGDMTMKVWDAINGQEILTLKGHSSGVKSVAFSPDGKRIASSGGSEIKIWDATSGEEILTLKGHRNGVLSVAFCPDGKRIASGSGDMTMKVWDAINGQEILTLKGHRNGVLSVAFCPDGKRIASGSADGTVRLWDATSVKGNLTLKGHRTGVTSVAFSPDGKRIASGSADDTIKVWNASNGREVLNLKGGGSCVAFSPDGKRIVGGSSDSTIKVWDAINGQEILRLEGDYFASSVAFSPDGKRIAIGSRGNTIPVWDAISGQEILTLTGHRGEVASVAFSPDGRRIVSGSRDKTVKAWDTSSGQEVLTLRGHTAGLTCVAFSPDGKRIVSGSGDRSVGNTDENPIRLWDATSGQEILRLVGPVLRVASVAFSPDGKRIVSGVGDYMIGPDIESGIMIWDATSGQKTLTLEGHSDVVTSVAFTPDGKRLASGSWDDTIIVWDASCSDIERVPPNASGSQYRFGGGFF